MDQRMQCTVVEHDITLRQRTTQLIDMEWLRVDACFTYNIIAHSMHYVCVEAGPIAVTQNTARDYLTTRRQKHQNENDMRSSLVASCVRMYELGVSRGKALKITKPIPLNVKSRAFLHKKIK